MQGKKYINIIEKYLDKLEIDLKKIRNKYKINKQKSISLSKLEKLIENLIKTSNDDINMSENFIEQYNLIKYNIKHHTEQINNGIYF